MSISVGLYIFACVGVARWYIKTYLPAFEVVKPNDEPSTRKLAKFFASTALIIGLGILVNVIYGTL